MADLKYLLVGGPADGQIEYVHEGADYIRVVVDKDEEVQIRPLTEPMPASASFDLATYRRCPLWTDGQKDIIVFVPQSGATVREILNRLIRGYRPKG